MTQFFISFCAGCILIGSLFIICPEGNISKPVKYVFTLIFLSVIISAANIPLKHIDFNFSKETATENNYLDMQTASAEYVYSYALTKQNINFSKIYVCTDNSETDSIVITKVIIVSDEPKEKIINALGELTYNREVEIVNE